MFTQYTKYDFGKVFQHRFIDGADRILKGNQTKFVHYTSAENAFNIIKGKKIWLRSSLTMNDYSEFSYGFDCLKHGLSSKVGKEIISVFDGLFDGKLIASESLKKFLDEADAYRQRSYCWCFSEFDGDSLLSMWRAYEGKNGVALVFNPSIFLHSSFDDFMGSMPVTYCNHAEIISELEHFLSLVKDNLDLLKNNADFYVRDELFNKLFSLAAYNKHPSFKEEKEWRMSYVNQSKNIMDLTPQVIKGVPQLVKECSLEKIRYGQTIYDISNLLEQVIIGPCEFPINIAQAFYSLLAEMNITNAYSKIVITNIPLRV
jgi:Protein of unknown function (DUF2971)